MNEQRHNWKHRDLLQTIRFLVQSVRPGRERQREKHHGFRASRAKHRRAPQAKMVVSPLTGCPVPRLRIGNGPASESRKVFDRHAGLRRAFGMSSADYREKLHRPKRIEQSEILEQRKRERLERRDRDAEIARRARL